MATLMPCKEKCITNSTNHWNPKTWCFTLSKNRFLFWKTENTLSTRHLEVVLEITGIIFTTYLHNRQNRNFSKKEIRLNFFPCSLRFSQQQINEISEWSQLLFITPNPLHRGDEIVSLGTFYGTNLNIRKNFIWYLKNEEIIIFITKTKELIKYCLEDAPY